MVPGDTGRTIARVIASENATDIERIVHALVDPSATIVTDEARAYMGLAAWFKHQSVKHSREYSVDDGTNTNYVESCFLRLRRMEIGQTHKFGSHLELCAAEAAYRRACGGRTTARGLGTLSGAFCAHQKTTTGTATGFCTGVAAHPSYQLRLQQRVRRHPSSDSTHSVFDPFDTPPAELFAQTACDAWVDVLLLAAVSGDLLRDFTGQQWVRRSFQHRKYRFRKLSGGECPLVIPVCRSNISSKKFKFNKQHCVVKRLDLCLHALNRPAMRCDFT